MWDGIDESFYGNSLDGGMGNPTLDPALGELGKALTAGGQLAGFQSFGGRALVLEDLERTLRVTTFGEKQFTKTLFNMLKTNAEQANGLVHEFVQMNDYGETGGFSPEVTTSLNPIDVDLTRGYTQVRFCRTKRQISKVTKMVKAMASHENLQVLGGTRFLISTTERTFYKGDSAMVPDEYDGIRKTAAANGGLVNLQGQSFTKDIINDGALQLVNANGVPSHMMMPLEVNSHLDRLLEGDKDRIVLYAGGRMTEGVPIGYGPTGPVNNNAIMAGAPLAGFRSSYGEIMFNAHIFTSLRKNVYKPKINNVPTEAATSPNAPATPTTVSATPAGSGGGFTGTGTGGAINSSLQYNGVYAGVYHYRVSAENSAGESIPCAAVNATVVSGGKITLVWDQMAGATCYRVYRSRNGGGATDVQFVLRVCGISANNVDPAVTYPGGNTVQWVDTNQAIAGCFDVHLLDLDSPGELKTLDWVQLAPMSRDMLPPADTTFQWIQFLFGALVYYAPAKIVTWTNVGIY